MAKYKSIKTYQTGFGRKGSGIRGQGSGIGGRGSGAGYKLPGINRIIRKGSRSQGFEGSSEKHFYILSILLILSKNLTRNTKRYFDRINMIYMIYRAAPDERPVTSIRIADSEVFVI